jgi:NAD(P)-dependent dehydrogenase (short-subunit alcohol dehydrogenase family)
VKTFLVTGASGGIGLQASRQIAEGGGHVVMVGHEPDKTAAAVTQVRAAAPGAAIDSMICDLGSQVEVRALSEQVLERLDRLDVLINNAGTVHAKRTLTTDGIEATFAVNHLGGFLLTELLKDLLIQSAPARVVFTSSVAHYRGTMDFDDLGFERGYQIMDAYSRSKLANVLYARHLADELEASDVTVNALHPGTVATDIWSGAPAYARPFLAVAKRFKMIAPEEGGRRITYLATSPEVEGRTGGYYEQDRLKQPSALACNKEVGQRLYDVSARLVGLS